MPRPVPLTGYTATLRWVSSVSVSVSDFEGYISVVSGKWQVTSETTVIRDQFVYLSICHPLITASVCLLPSR